MTEQQAAEALALTTMDTLEQAAFLLCESCGEIAPAWVEDELVVAELSLAGGGRQGLLALAAEPALCRVLAANLLGLESGQDAAEARELAPSALGELCNMIAGAWLEAVLGEGTPCTIGIPGTARLSGATLQARWARPGTLRTSLLADEGLRLDVLARLLPAAEGQP